MGIMRKMVDKLFMSISSPDSPLSSESPQTLNLNLQVNLLKIKQSLGDSSDIIFRTIKMGKNESIAIALIYIDGLIDSKSAQNFVMESLMFESRSMDVKPKKVLEVLKDSLLTVTDLKEVHLFHDLLDKILSGHMIILVEGYTQGFAIGLQGFEQRGISEPETEGLVRGPKEGFTESLRTNITLVRRKIKHPNFRVESKKIGSLTKTDIAILYIQDLVDEQILDELRKRLMKIDTDSILESGYIEEFIQDQQFTPFPTVQNTERPDAVAAALLEGRVAVVVDGTPFVLIVPALFSQFYQSPEDYYQSADFATFTRILRILSLFIALLAPSLYIAVSTYHQEMLPTALLYNLAAQREGVPFPAFIEALFMEITLEILREAGIRLPKSVGSAVSIVGALVIGQAAVEAGLVSAAMVIVVSITAISSFAFPAFHMAIPIRLLRFAFILLAATLGLFGITTGLIALILHLCRLKSFGVPYMSPFAPLVLSKQKDTLIRVPRNLADTRSRKKLKKNKVYD
ncbi:spore germination protein [Heyndrickxia acidicola]|uniref:Spore germination protein n=1 Tax=Heyndrickxia acidicola TaxID=209389 RepID=A0ABU6MJH1_9BACI|nr:spore germination protein [Heyndrickxia acidicola]MED1204562.1 spore germination protein [Heyndrickxia acidicola]